MADSDTLAIVSVPAAAHGMVWLRDGQGLVAVFLGSIYFGPPDSDGIQGSGED